MKAYRFTDPSKGLEYTEVPIPVPEKNQVLIEVRAAGLCHTDCNIISGDDNTFFWKRPITLGHELAGVVVKVGSDVTKFKVGDRVLPIISTQHPITFADVTSTPGMGYDGGFAEYAVLFESKALHIPEAVTFPQAAVAADAVATAYHAVVVEGQITEASKIAMIGLGGLGLSAAQIASVYGAKVYGIERDSRKYGVAAQVGVHACAKSFDGFPGIQFDVVVDFVGAGDTTAAAAKAVKPGGRVVLVGLGRKRMTLDSHKFVTSGVTLIGSAGSTAHEVEKSLQMIANKQINPLLEEVPFGEIKEQLERLAKGNVIGRLYADPTAAQRQ
ncbi:hypothetical protein FDECE_14183 [Fusarium decemcellulare]|nr:hypothetical protein FDECE_14183 [Fusarium decemcellulare]